MIVSTTSALMTEVLCHPGTSSLRLISDLSPKSSRRSHDGFNGQHGHDVQNGYNGHDNLSHHNGHNKFFAQRQTRKGLILPEEFFGGRHQNRYGLVLGMPFFTLSCADIRFAKSSSGQCTRLQTTKRVEIFGPKELAALALRANNEAL